MSRWDWINRRRGNPPERWLGSATSFAAGRGCYAREALPAWVTEPTDEQPMVDPWALAADGELDQGADPDGDGRRQAPLNRSRRFPRECGADRGYPPGWQA